VGKVDGKFKLCPKCYSDQNNALWEEKKALVREQLARLSEKPDDDATLNEEAHMEASS
jgi:hypothetical protein